MRSLWKRACTLRFSILLIVLLCWLLPTVILGGYMGTRFFTALKEKTEISLTTRTQQAQVRVVENLDAVITLAKDVVYDDELAAAVQGYESGSVSYESYFTQCRSYLERKFGRERLIDFALFFRMKAPNGIFFTTDDYPEAVYFQENVLKRTLEEKESLETGCAFMTSGGRAYLVRNLYNTKMELYGMLALGLNEERLFTPASEAAAAMGMQYSVEVGEISLGDGRFMRREQGISQEGDLLLCTQETRQRDYTLRLQTQADRHAVYGEIEAFKRLMAWLVVLLAPICAAILYFVDKRITRPIRLLSDASARIRGGELGVTVPMHGGDELGQLGSAFSGMSLRLKQLVDKSYKEEIALRDAEIQALQSRINAHFLNNALETINWQARMEGSETICEMVEALSCLLNASMDRDERRLAPLGEELRVADAYFYFVGLRYGSRLTVWKDVEESAKALMVPRMAVQTMVENAIEHGVAKAGGGRIRLCVRTAEERLIVEVTNNQRLAPEDAERVRGLLSDEGESKGHMGLRNVARRLRLLFGDKATISLRASDKGETVAAFSIPALTAEQARQYDKEA